MKVFLTLAIALFSSAAFAQDTSSVRSQAPSSPNVRTGSHGVYVGLDYMNVTDVKSENSFSSDIYSGSSKNTQGTSLGMLGFRVGFDSTPIEGIGFSAGLRRLEKMNKNENGSFNIQFYIPEVNLHLAANSSFLFYLGANTLILRGDEIFNDVKGDLGGQIGLGLRLTNHVVWNLGYTVLRAHSNSSSDGFSQSSKVEWSGFNTNLTAIF